MRHVVTQSSHNGLRTNETKVQFLFVLLKIPDKILRFLNKKTDKLQENFVKVSFGFLLRMLALMTCCGYEVTGP
jgi:hypothetical protein